LERAREFGYKGGTLEAIENFVLMIKSFSSMLQHKNAYEVAVHVGKQTGFVRELFNDKSTEGVARYENIQELLNSIKEWVESANLPAVEDVVTEGDQAPGDDFPAAPGGGENAEEKNAEGYREADNIAELPEPEDKGLGAYLQQITLLTDADNKNADADTVKLMTIHAAKGLEFGCVFAAGLEESLFPNAMSINTREELEEERRLFYVVVTRAKQKLWITHANSRYRFGSLIQNEPSRFINEIPEEYLDRSFAGGGARNGLRTSAFERMRGGAFGDAPRSTAWQAEKQYGAPPGKKKDAAPAYIGPRPQNTHKEHQPSPGFTASDTSGLQAGQKVEHQKFGFGEVIKVEGSAQNPIALVRFEHNGEKKIMLNYAKLRIIS
jgi:DNA helicase-2/ATP-dependent DNA helicase PcrA